MLEIRPIGPDDPTFRAWHAVITAAYAADREPGWWESFEATRDTFLDPDDRTGHLALVAEDDGVVVGGAELSLPLDDDTETMSVELGVAPDRRGRGVGAALADEVLRRGRSGAATSSRPSCSCRPVSPEVLQWC